MEMENILLKYMSERFGKASAAREAQPGPFITLSRQFGCPAREVSDLLKKRLFELSAGSRAWDLLNKEILTASAEKLSLHPKDLEDFYQYHDRTAIDDILASMSAGKHYRSEKAIKETLRDTLLSFARRGHAILVGRGAVAITHDIPNGLHVKLQAPEAWRVERVKSLRGLTLAEARESVRENDAKRQALRDEFWGKPLDDMAFDLVLNCQGLGTEALVETILAAAKGKGILAKP